MPRYSSDIISRARVLRSQGKTYAEIKTQLNIVIPKSTLSDWCKNVILPSEYINKIVELNKINAHKGRVIALIANQMKRRKLLDGIRENNISIAKEIHKKTSAKIALAMLCLGEASKSGKGSAFYLGSSDPKIILLFINLLKRCFDFEEGKIRCTIQCRADQDIEKLEAYWQKVTNIPSKLFYPTRVDSRTIGKPTRKTDYKGVLRVDYFNNNIRLELEALADLVYNETISMGL